MCCTPQRRFVRAPDEPFDEFKDRVLDAAAEAGEQFVVICAFQ